MKKTAYLLIIALLPLFISCQKEIKFKGEITDPKLVLNAFVTHDSIVSIHLSQSNFILTTNADVFKNIENATVKLYVNGAFKENLLHSRNGWYCGKYILRPNENIKIEAKANGFVPIIAQSVIPQRPTMTLVEKKFTDKEKVAKNYEYGDVGTDKVYKNIIRDTTLSLKMDENGNEDNFYFIKITRNHYTHKNGTKTLISSANVDVKLSEILKRNPVTDKKKEKDIFSIDADEYESINLQNIFNYVLINGKTVYFDFAFSDIVGTKVYLNNKDITPPEYQQKNETVEYEITISEVSKDYYLYVISSISATQGKPLMEPIQIHSNIENGIGILGTYSRYCYKFHIDFI